MTTINKDIPYASDVRLSVMLGNADVLAVHFRVPADAPVSEKTGSVMVAPTVDGSAGILQGVLSTAPGVFDGYQPGSSPGHTPSIKFCVGSTRDFTARVEPGKDYYLNVQVFNPAPTQAPSDIFVTFTKPATKHG